MEKATSGTIKYRRFFAKSTKKVNVFKQKQAQEEKESRRRLKAHLTQLSDAQRAQVRSQGRVRIYRQKKQRKGPSQRQSQSRYDYDHSFATDEEFEEAVAKVKRSLPKSPALRKAVLRELFLSLDEESQRDIIASWEQENRFSLITEFAGERSPVPSEAA